MDLITTIIIDNEAGDGHTLVFHIALTIIAFLAYNGYKIMVAEAEYDVDDDGLDKSELNRYWKKNRLRIVVTFIFTLLFFMIPNQAMQFIAPSLGDGLTLDLSYVGAGFAGMLIQLWLDKRKKST